MMMGGRPAGYDYGSIPASQSTQRYSADVADPFGDTNSRTDGSVTPRPNQSKGVAIEMDISEASA